MYKLCVIEDSALRQRELEKGFLSVLSTHSYEDLSVSDLCRHLGISRKCFYRYFSGKEGILMALLDHTLMDFQLILNSADTDQLTPEIILQYSFTFWENQKPLLDVLEQNKLSMLLYQRALEIFSPNALSFSNFIPEEPSSLFEQRIRFIICGLMTMIISWHHCGYQPPIGQMVQASSQLLTKPLLQFSVV